MRGVFQASLQRGIVKQTFHLVNVALNDVVSVCQRTGKSLTFLNTTRRGTEQTSHIFVLRGTIVRTIVGSIANIVLPKPLQRSFPIRYIVLPIWITMKPCKYTKRSGRTKFAHMSYLERSLLAIVHGVGVPHAQQRRIDSMKLSE